MQSPEGRPGSLLRRSLEAAFNVTVLDFEVSLGIDGARSVVDGDFLVVELRLFPVGIRMDFLFAFKLECAVRDNHVFFGAVSSVVVRRAPVIRRVPLFLVEAGAVEVVFEHLFPAAEIRRWVGKNQRGR